LLTIVILLSHRALELNCHIYVSPIKKPVYYPSNFLGFGKHYHTLHFFAIIFIVVHIWMRIFEICFSGTGLFHLMSASYLKIAMKYRIWFFKPEWCFICAHITFSLSIHKSTGTLADSTSKLLWMCCSVPGSAHPFFIYYHIIVV
jgi:hypothetical protein